MATQIPLAVLTGDSADDSMAISAGTGQKLNVAGGGAGSPTNPVTNAAATRPSLTVVYWQCATQPTHLAPGDIWILYP